VGADTTACPIACRERCGPNTVWWHVGDLGRALTFCHSASNATARSLRRFKARMPSDQASLAALLWQHAEQHAIPAYRDVPTGRTYMEEYESVGQPLTDGDVSPECEVLQRIVLR
jgi:hypothetical protein